MLYEKIEVNTVSAKIIKNKNKALSKFPAS